MAAKIPSEHDLELLSAYLDGELSDRDRQHLEQRLIQDTGLRSTFNDLRETVSLLKGLPLLKAPHDFTLDPAAYRSPGFSFYNLLQFSGALGTIAAMLLIAFSVFFQAENNESASPLEKDQQSQIAVVPTLPATPDTDAGEEEVFTFQATMASEGEVPAAGPPMGTPTLMQMQADTFQATVPQAPVQPPSGFGAAESGASLESPQPQPLEASGAAAYDSALSATTTATATPSATPSLLPTSTRSGTSTPDLQRETDEQPSMKATAVAVVPTIEHEQPQVVEPSESRPDESEETSTVWLAQLGLVLLAVSVFAFVWGYWKARH